MLAVREADRLIEAGVRHGIEKRVMDAYPHFFVSAKGKKRQKTGMLGRWMTQADEQQWRKVPWEKLSTADRGCKELPDWLRVSIGLAPRSLARFKEGKNVPAEVQERLVDMINRVTCGEGPTTSGTLEPKTIQKEGEKLLAIWSESKKQACQEAGLPEPDVKKSISTKWTRRFMDLYGWRSRKPNTYGSYLDYEDQRMIRSRKTYDAMRPWTGDGGFWKWKVWGNHSHKRQV